jgi:hypothetical protein
VIDGDLEITGALNTAGSTKRIWIPVKDFVFDLTEGTVDEDVVGVETNWYPAARLNPSFGREIRYWYWTQELPADIRNYTVTVGHVFMGTAPESDVDLEGWVRCWDAGTVTDEANVEDWSQWERDFALADNQLVEITETWTNLALEPGNYFSVRCELGDLYNSQYMLGAYVEYVGD